MWLYTVRNYPKARGIRVREKQLLEYFLRWKKQVSVHFELDNSRRHFRKQRKLEQNPLSESQAAGFEFQFREKTDEYPIRARIQEIIQKKDSPGLQPELRAPNNHN